MCSKKPNTKLKTINEFVQRYGGPEIDMHTRYSVILNLVCTTFMHGIALPILFPITLFGIANKYFTETILFAYYFKAPPLYDNQLNI